MPKGFWRGGYKNFTDLDILKFDERSDENMTNFYKKELEAGLFREITTGARKQLKRHGILTRKGNRNMKGYRLTEKGLKLLEELEREG